MKKLFDVKVMKALVVKDFWLHGREVLVALLVVAMVARFFQALRPERSSLDLMTYHALLMGVAGVLFSEWFVLAERANQTIIWLRTLPVSDTQVVGSKYLWYAGVHWFGTFASALLADPSWVVQYPGRLVAYAAYVQLFGGALLTGRFLLGAKASVIVPATLALIVLIVGRALPPPLLLSVPVALVASGVMSLAAIKTTTVILGRRDPSRWVV